jgi:phosphoglycolate phosphatase
VAAVSACIRRRRHTGDFVWLFGATRDTNAAASGDTMLRAILFDKDGTLLDFEATWTPVLKRVALEAASGDATRAASLLRAGGFDAASGRVRGGSVIAAGTNADLVRLWWPELAAAAFEQRTEAVNRVFLDHGRRNAVLIDGVRGALSALGGRGLAMGIATNDATEAARTTIAALGLSRFLPHVIGYDAVVAAKPAPDMVHAFAALTGIPVNQMAMVGDNEHDLAMARTAGVGVAVGVLSGNSSIGELTPLADVVLPSVRDLPAWLDQNRK